jgi:hypothetical protein
MAKALGTNTETLVGGWPDAEAARDHVKDALHTGEKVLADGLLTQSQIFALESAGGPGFYSLVGNIAGHDRPGDGSAPEVAEAALAVMLWNYKNNGNVGEHKDIDEMIANTPLNVELRGEHPTDPDAVVIVVNGRPVGIRKSFLPGLLDAAFKEITPQGEKLASRPSAIDPGAREPGIGSRAATAIGETFEGVGARMNQAATDRALDLTQRPR